MRLFSILTHLVYIIVCVWGANWSFDMHGDADLNGYDCNNGEYAFSSVITRSVIQCAYQCSVDAKCKSMFYVPGTSAGTCSGCTARYASTELNTLSLNALQGSVYHVSTFDFIWGTSGYLFIDTLQSFTVGEGMCNTLGGYPVAIETEEEYDFLAFRLELITAGHTYIGLDQPVGTVTDFIWQGTGQVLSYNGFNENEPNNDAENCVMAVPHNQYAWSDIFCYKNYNILCEVAIN